MLAQHPTCRYVTHFLMQKSTLHIFGGCACNLGVGVPLDAYLQCKQHLLAHPLLTMHVCSTNKFNVSLTFTTAIIDPTASSHQNLDAVAEVLVSYPVSTVPAHAVLCTFCRLHEVNYCHIMICIATCCNLTCSTCVATVLISLCKRLWAVAAAKDISICSILYKKALIIAVASISSIPSSQNTWSYIVQ